MRWREDSRHEELPKYCLLFVRAVCFLSADYEICHPGFAIHSHSDHKIMKGAVKICGITGSHTEVNIFLPTKKIALHEAADCVLSGHMGCFRFHSMSLKSWPFMNHRHTHMLVLATFVCLHFGKR